MLFRFKNCFEKWFEWVLFRPTELNDVQNSQTPAFPVNLFKVVVCPLVVCVNCNSNFCMGGGFSDVRDHCVQVFEHFIIINRKEDSFRAKEKSLFYLLSLG